MIAAYLLIALMLAVGAVPIIRELQTRTFDFFNLKNLFILYYFVQLGISGAITLTSGAFSEVGLDPSQNYDTYLETLFLAAGGLLMFQLGYYTPIRSSIALPMLLRRPWVPGRHIAVAVIFTVIGYLSLALLLAENGGIDAFLSSREEFRGGGMSGQGILIFPATSIITIGALVFLIGSTQNRRRVNFYSVAFVLMISIFPAYILGFRSLIGLPILQFMVAWNYGYRRLSKSRIVLAIAIIGLGFTLYGVIRELPQETSIDMVGELLHERPELAYSLVARSKGTEVVASVIKKLDATGMYDLGWKSLLESFTIAIPKSIWPSKPIPSSQRFTTYFFGDEMSYARGYDLEVWGGISPTVVGELYWHFGVFGVLIGLFLLGLIASNTYRSLRTNISSSSAIILYSIVFTTFVMFSEAIQGYVNLLILYLPVLFCTFFGLTVRSRFTYK